MNRTGGATPPDGRGQVPDRWNRYSPAPRRWASAENAAAVRRAEGRPLPGRAPASAQESDGGHHPQVRADTDPVQLPSSRAWWVALAAASTTALGLASCLAWMLW